MEKHIKSLNTIELHFCLHSGFLNLKRGSFMMLSGFLRKEEGENQGYVTNKASGEDMTFLSWQ